MYMEVSKILSNLEARKVNTSRLYPSVLIKREDSTATVLGPTRILSSKWDAFNGIFKTYWNNRSYVGDFVNFLKDKTLNMTSINLNSYLRS